MKRLLLVLVLANVLTFGWNRGWFDGGSASTAAREEHAERLRPVPLSRLEPPPKPIPEPRPSGRAATRSPDSAVSTPTPPAQTAPPAAPSGSPSGSPSAPSGSPSAPSGSPSAPSGSPSAPSGSPPSAPSPSAPSPTPPGPAAPSAAPGPNPFDARSSPRGTPSTPAADASPQPISGGSSTAGFAFAACRAFPPIDEERAQALRAALEQGGARVEARRIEQGASYLVYLPPAPSVAEAQQRLVDLRRIGRGDAFVIQDGPMRLAISIGLFRFESAARLMLDQLVRAGETRAVVAPRPPIQVRVALQARWPQADGASIAAMLGSQFDAPARDCD